MADSVTGEQADVIVLGAGIVGVSAAYAARQRGLSVVLVDRREPGSETSYGNAGILSSGSITPLNVPSLWNALPGPPICCGRSAIASRWPRSAATIKSSSRIRRANCCVRSMTPKPAS